jgi:hypothetical protein
LNLLSHAIGERRKKEGTEKKEGTKKKDYRFRGLVEEEEPRDHLHHLLSTIHHCHHVTKIIIFIILKV